MGAFDRGCFRLSRSASEPAAQTESHRLQATSPAQQRAGPDSAGQTPAAGLFEGLARPETDQS